MINFITVTGGQKIRPTILNYSRVVLQTGIPDAVQSVQTAVEVPLFKTALKIILEGFSETITEAKVPFVLAQELAFQVRVTEEV